MIDDRRIKQKGSQKEIQTECKYNGLSHWRLILLSLDNPVNSIHRKANNSLNPEPLKQNYDTTLRRSKRPSSAHQRPFVARSRRVPFSEANGSSPEPSSDRDSSFSRTFAEILTNIQTLNTHDNGVVLILTIDQVYSLHN